MIPHARSSLSLVALGALAGCQMGPTNGTTITGSVIGRSFSFNGFHDQPSTLISLQVLNNPASDPAVAANWIQFATAISSANPTMVNDPNPLFQWAVDAIPVPDRIAGMRWPQGGIARVRAVVPSSNTALTTFDEVTFPACFDAQIQAGASWVTIGTQCAGTGGATAALVSTGTVPIAAGTAATFGGFLGKKGTITPAETSAYYAATGAPATLAAFRSSFGFPTGEVTATYYNDVELGLGREVHCKPTAGGGLACYMSNYSGVPGLPAFGQDPSFALADAVRRIGAYATLTMTYSGTPGPGSIKFAAYNAAGNLATTVQLDSTANNVSIPNTCIACHGIDGFYTASTRISTSVKFLPFDPFSFKYATAAGFTFADQVDELRRLNALIRTADPTVATVELIDGMYAPKAVTDPTAVANNTFVPAAWNVPSGNQAGRSLYQGVVKVGCRTCHVSATSSELDFNARADFDLVSGLTRAEVCGPTHLMPHAERTMKKFWDSGARAYLVTAYPSASYPDPVQGCRP